MAKDIRSFIFFAQGLICLGQGKFEIRVDRLAMLFKIGSSALGRSRRGQGTRIHQAGIVKQQRIGILLLEICKRSYDILVLLLRLMRAGIEKCEVVPQHRSNSLGVLPRRHRLWKIIIKVVGIAQDQMRKRPRFISLVLASIGLDSRIGLGRAVLQ